MLLKKSNKLIGILMAKSFNSEILGRFRIICLAVIALCMTNLSYGGSSPTADFSVDNTAPVIGQTVKFTDASSSNTNEWSWNFGAGANPATSTSQGPINVNYGSTGSKTVTLKASNNWGEDTETKTNYITVNPTPVPTAGNNGPVCAGSALSLTASTISGATYHWTGPNGYTSTVQNPTVSSSATTAMAGTYSVTVTLYGYTGSPGTTTVTVNTTPTAPTGISGTTTICSGTSTTLTATGGSEGGGCTYQWGTGATVGSNIISGATSVSYTTPALTANTTYWVRRVGLSPCSNTTGGVSQLITVNALPSASTGIASNPSTICQGSSSTISVSNPGTNLTTDWFTGSCGGTQVGTSVNSLSVSPSATTTYYARTRNTLTGCVAASCGNISVAVNPAPAITAQPASGSICSGQSTNLTVTASNNPIYQWQSSTDGTNWSYLTSAFNTNSVFFTSDFTALPANSNVYGNASITGGVLQLTPASGNQTGGFVIQSTPGVNLTAVDVNFDYRIWDGSGADGFSMSYGSNIANNAGTGEEGEGSGIIVKFDTYDNNAGNTNSQIRVNYNGVQIWSNTLGSYDLRNSGYRNVHLYIDHSGNLSLSISGTQIISSLAITGYAAADKSAWKFKFSGRTGGLNDTHRIDNLRIQYGDNPLLSITPSSTMYYRAIVYSGTCFTTSSTATVTVSPASVGGTATAASSAICAGTNTTVTVAGYTGSIQWQQSANGTSGWTNVTGGSGATTATYTTPALSTTTYYRALVTSGACSSANSTTALVTVSAASVGGTASAAANALCSGSGTTINLSGQTGSTIQWQQSPDGTSNWTTVASGSTAYSTGNLTSNSYYRAVVTNGICASSSSNVAGVFINPEFVWNGSSNDWSSSSNWKFSSISDNPNVPPLSCSNVTIPKLASGNYPTISAHTTINNLTINDGGSILGNSNLTVSGTTTMQKEVTDDHDWSWHFLSSPVSDQYIWNQFVPTPPNGSGPGSWSWATNNISWDFYYFNPYITNVYPNEPWVNLKKAASGSNYPYNNGSIDDHDPVTGAEAGFGNAQPVFETGRGYLVAYNYDAGQGPVYPSTMHNFTGSLNYGDVPVTLIRTGSLYQLIGNPYPSYLDWEDPDWTRNGLASSENQSSGFDYWVFDDGPSGGNYLVGNSTGTYSTGISRRIAPMQGFFVKVNNTSGAFTFSESVRSHGTQDWVESAISRNNLLRLQLTTSQNNFHDELMIDFREQFSGQEGTEKFYSMNTYAPELWSVKNGHIYTIDRYKKVTSDLKVNVSVKCGVTGTYTITATNINDFALSNIVYLEDLKTGNKVNLKETGSYSFTGSPNDNKDRFTLYFAEITGKEELASARKVNIFSYGKDVFINTGNENTGRCEVYIYDEIGRLIESGRCQPANGNVKYTTLRKPGVYIIKVLTGSGVTTTKVIIQ